MFLGHRDKVNRRKGIGCFFEVKIMLKELETNETDELKVKIFI